MISMTGCLLIERKEVFVDRLTSQTVSHYRTHDFITMEDKIMPIEAEKPTDAYVDIVELIP